MIYGLQKFQELIYRTTTTITAYQSANVFNTSYWADMNEMGIKIAFAVSNDGVYMLEDEDYVTWVVRLKY